MVWIFDGTPKNIVFDMLRWTFTHAITVSNRYSLIREGHAFEVQTKTIALMAREFKLYQVMLWRNGRLISGLWDTDGTEAITQIETRKIFRWFEQCGYGPLMELYFLLTKASFNLNTITWSGENGGTTNWWKGYKLTKRKNEQTRCF